MIYADHAATTKISETAKLAMLSAMEEDWYNPSSLYTPGQQASGTLMDARVRIARCLGCLPKEIYFTSGGSEADNQAILSAAAIGKRQGKMHIISTAFEHHAVLHTLKKLEKEGFEITLLDVGEKGIVSPAQVEKAIRPDTALVTVMYANNEIGTIQPIREIGAVCRQNGVLFHTDAVQAAGHLPINVEEDQVDMLSLSAHKFNGPKGIGVLYAKTGVFLTNLIEGGGQERGKRAGTENLPAIVGMAAALEEACSLQKERSIYVTKLREQLINGLKKIPGALLNGDATNRLPGNVNFCFPDTEAEGLLLLLDNKGICASSGSACTSGFLDPSHVLLAIGRDKETARGSLRLTLDYENTKEEVEMIIQAVAETVKILRGE
ncbi:cysteine desulfurase [Anthropogastromicrobium aceti]|uniref:cysteine desulfurase family protein n=1 Tax=Anthropogastromicrobium aceti TaxID=2981768 RepID=UPI00082267A8|nr:cysteine desulfurase family protein [Anthropogastromicrobium aceti]MCU6784439.1 cysteine desulfurase [Anthropogastromicrobium aceti]SCJ66758.1 Cysteine desulfurase [uncultured Lachnospira sp.]